MPSAKKKTPPPAKAASVSIELGAAAEEALCRRFKDHAREVLKEGAEYAIDLKIQGTVNGELFSDACQGTLHVGHDTEASSSSGPSAANLLGAVLAKLGPKTRTKILREIPAEYSAAGNRLPEIDEAIQGQAEATLKAMRSSETITKKGAVKFSSTPIANAV